MDPLYGNDIPVLYKNNSRIPVVSTFKKRCHMIRDLPLKIVELPQNSPFWIYESICLVHKTVHFYENKHVYSFLIATH